MRSYTIFLLVPGLSLAIGLPSHQLFRTGTVQGRTPESFLPPTSP